MKAKNRVGRKRTARATKSGRGRVDSLNASGRDDSAASSWAWRRPLKKRITLYLDADVLAWFKQKPRYQREINRALWRVVREESGDSLE